MLISFKQVSNDLGNVSIVPFTQVEFRGRPTREHNVDFRIVFAVLFQIEK